MSTPVNRWSGGPARELDPLWAELRDRSTSLLRDTQNQAGSWPASPTFPPYGFCWFRDGAFIADGASAAGMVEAADRFHGWCAGVLQREADSIANAEKARVLGTTLPDDEYLPARYRLDGSRQRDDWWNFQVDGYGTWLWALRRHVDRHRGSAHTWGEGIQLAARYLVATGLDSCRDWWEENRDQRHVSTLAGVIGGLDAAGQLVSLPPGLADRAAATAAEARSLISRHGVHDGRLTKWLGGGAVDASLLSVAALYDVLALDDARIIETVAEIERALTSGPTRQTGVHRYLADVFYGGGQWPVLACLLATHHLRSGDRARAGQLLDWVASSADDGQLLPEQTGPRLAPEAISEWEERWGPSAHPLLWSHGAFLSAVEVWQQ